MSTEVIATNSLRHSRLVAAFGAGAPWVLWLIGLAVMTVRATESLFSESPPEVAVVAAFATYVTAATVAFLLAGFMFLFAFSCSLMLSWLKESVRPAIVARAVCLAFWAMTANAWAGAVYVLVEPPPAIDIDELLAMPADDGAEDILGLPWLDELQYVSAIAFVIACSVVLSRHVKRLHALLAVLFAAATVAFVTSVIGWLGNTGL